MAAARTRLMSTDGPATVYVAPTSRKIAAPIIAPTAAIVMSNRPRSRITRTRTEPDSNGERATARGDEVGYLSLWRWNRKRAFEVSRFPLGVRGRCRLRNPLAQGAEDE